MDAHSCKPTVTIGLPVYNGERHIAEAIDSILAQTYPNFELIISDNASTDRTEEICRKYAERDQRIRYRRNPTNLGAAANFNCLLACANQSKYFKWAAHDDWVSPTYLDQCIHALESNPDAVLCQSLVQIVDAQGRYLKMYAPRTGADLPSPSKRLSSRLEGHCVDIFGVIRSDALRSTRLLRTHLESDRVLLLELALCGPFVFVPQQLFFDRNHAERFSQSCSSVYTPREELAWYDPNTLGWHPWRAWRRWVVYVVCFRLIATRVDPFAERLHCYASLCRSIRRRWGNLILEPIMTLNPHLFRAIMRIRQIRSHRATKTSASADRM